MSLMSPVGEIPIPTLSDLVPMVPGALLGAGLAFASTFVARRLLRSALCVAAAITPWVVTWAATHDGAVALLTSGTSSERAALALLLWTIATISLPTSGSRKRVIGAAALRWIATSTAIAWTLWTFLDPKHPFAISISTVVLLGALGLATGAIAFAAERIHAMGTPAALAAIASALGLLLVGIGDAAALSQVVAATSIAAGVTSGLMLVAGPHRLAPGLVAAWFAAAVLATLDAHFTSDDPLPIAALGVLGLAAIVPWLAALATKPGARRLRPAILTAMISGILAAGAVAVAVWSTNSNAQAVEDPTDPYGGLDDFK